MFYNVRTDLASESNALYNQSASALPGVVTNTENQKGFELQSLEITDSASAEKLGKPVGKYLTLYLDKLLKRGENAFEDAALVIAMMLRRLDLPLDGDILIACLGNADITPDALGPLAAQSILVTRHLKKSLPEDFAAFRSVSVVRTGVLGTTGLESAENVRAACGAVSPVAVIAIDALASADLSRLCRTVQISDVGIAPGSGVGNDRAALNRDFLGVPVIAVGVPTVIDAAAFSTDEDAKGMFVTPRNIDDLVRRTAKLIGYGINLALHDGINCADLDMLLE